MFTRLWQRGLIMALGLVMLIGLIANYPEPGEKVTAAEQSDLRTLTVAGFGQVSLKPDLARVHLGVETTASTASEAMARNARIMNAVVEAIKQQGVADEDIRTTGLSLHSYREPSPIYREPSGGAPSPEARPPVPVLPLVFRASNNVQVTVRDLDKVVGVIDGAVAKGSNLVSGVSFGLEDQTLGQRESLAAAVQNARRKADTLAQEAGVSITGVQSISEGGSYGGPVPLEGRSGAPAAGTPLSPGSLP